MRAFIMKFLFFVSSLYENVGADALSGPFGERALHFHDSLCFLGMGVLPVLPGRCEGNYRKPVDRFRGCGTY